MGPQLLPHEDDRSRTASKPRPGQRGRTGIMHHSNPTFSNCSPTTWKHGTCQCHKLEAAERRRTQIDSRVAKRGRSPSIISGLRRLRLALSLIPTTILFKILLLASLVPSGGSVRIPFSNCLPDSYRLNEPPPLQFNPVFVDARFDTKDHKHTLQLILWGNVTGEYNQGVLPPPSDPYWRNDNETNGKIIRDPEPNSQHPKATTLKKQVDVVTYTPYSNAVDFCDSALVNSSCPLPPVFEHVDFSNASSLPSINITNDFFSSYAFTSFSATFLVIYGDAAATDIGCASATITPDLGSISWVLEFIPLMVLLITGFAVIFASIWSPWGTTDIFHWTSNYGRDADLLRLVTPGFGDCLQYIQFIVLTGGLSLDYPGFYQPIISRGSWSTLMFNQSLVTNSPSWKSVVDGIYVTNGTHGLEILGQLDGMAKPQDIWAGMMVWLCVIIVAVFVIIQVGFLAQWVYRKSRRTPEEDLVAKNIPFSIGNVIRIIYNYFLLPIVALSAFQLVISHGSPAYTVALAAVTLVLLVVFAAYVLLLIIRTRPKSVLFDDLPIVLRYGPLYNTYSDDVAAFALVPVLLTILRGLAIGAVQQSGIAQVVLLAICEVIHILTLNAFRPFQSPTSMNAYHTAFSALRLVSIMLMVAFSPSLGVTDGSKGWIGYAILLIHGCVLIFGYFLSALQTIAEVIARLLGAGGDDVRGLTRGGLSKIFGARQLSRRVAHHRPGPSRASQLSTSAMLDVESGSKAGGSYAMDGGRIRSESAASMSGFGAAARPQRNSSALDSYEPYSGATPQRNPETASSYIPGTPGQASTFSFPASSSHQRHQSVNLNLAMDEPSDPYYRPPRKRGNTMGEYIDTEIPDPSLIAIARDQRLIGQTPGGGPSREFLGGDGMEISRGATPAPPGQAPMTLPPNRPDYATREVDFYYGVRGPALNSDGPGRKLGTGPADPTGPVATATGWFRNNINMLLFGGKSKEKGKGFEVVRSSRMPPGMMARNGAFGDETPPEGIPVAMGVIRNGPIDSDDDDDDAPRIKSPAVAKKGILLTDTGEPQPDPDAPESPTTERAPQIGHLPGLPRSISQRQPGFMESSNASRSGDGGSEKGEPGGNESHLSPADQRRLPFERTTSQKRLSSKSSMEFPGAINTTFTGERPASFGTVSHHEVNRVEQQTGTVDLLGSSAELINEEGAERRRSPSS